MKQRKNASPRSKRSSSKILRDPVVTIRCELDSESDGFLDLESLVNAIRFSAIMQALEYYRWNKDAAAKVLRLTPRVLNSHMETLGIRWPGYH